jgi:rubrerythrin
MFPVNFYIAISAYMGAIVAFLVGIWMWIEFNAHGGYMGGLGAAQRKWRCDYCGYVYLGGKEENISQCPRCQSYNKT